MLFIKRVEKLKEGLRFSIPQYYGIIYELEPISVKVLLIFSRKNIAILNRTFQNYLEKDFYTLL